MKTSEGQSRQVYTMEWKQTLTNEEMEELSGALSIAGESAIPAEVRVYDFVHPSKLSKANMRAVQLVYSGLERPWAETIGRTLRDEAQVQASTVQQASFGNYADSVHDSSLFFSLTMDALPGHAFIEIPAAAALSIADRMAGGTGRIDGDPGLTDVSRSVVGCLMKRLMEGMAQAWSPVVTVNCTIGECHTAIDQTGLEENEPVLVTQMNCIVGTLEIRFNLIQSVETMNPVLKELDPKRWAPADETVSGQSSTLPAAMLGDVDMTLVVSLGSSVVHLGDVLDMEVGDVLTLGTGTRDLLDMQIGEQTRFRGRPGLVGNRLSVQVVERVGDSIVESQPRVGVA